ncbi:MAG: hypothetical protein QME94_01455 [Anaerolineae bacterium]|nr:hypothetical protein [Anaerolineae bacterium]
METFTESTAAAQAGGQDRERQGAWARRLPWLVVLAAIAGLAVREVADPDLWWHLATGRYIVSQRSIPATDVFSFTALDHRWVTHEWLSDLLLYGGYQLFGLNGLAVVFGGVVAISFGLVFARCSAPPSVAAWAVLLGAVASAMTWGVRPQMLSLLFASLYLYILEKRPERVWLLPPLALLWANLHSGFVSGLVILAVFAVAAELSWLASRSPGQRLLGAWPRQLALVFLASVACSLVTPNGVSAALFPFGTLSNRLIQSYIQEWFSPNFHQPWAWPLLAYWLVLLATLAASTRRPRLEQVLLLLGAAAAGLYSTRHVTFLSLIGAPLLADQAVAAVPGIATWSRRPRRKLPMPVRLVLAVGLVALVVALGVRVSNMAKANARLGETRYPAAALAYMREHNLGGRILHTYHWGGYLIWQGYEVFVDGRAELYGDEILGEYLEAFGVRPGWEEPLRKYDVDVILTESGEPFAVLLEESPRWRAVHSDSVATVFVPAD